MALFDKDITIDEEAFAKASGDFEVLSADLEKLRGKIETMLTTLSKGFDTPCGVKFYKSCSDNLLKPIGEQKIVIDHIKDALNTAKTQYQSVFEAYRALNSSVSSYSG